MTTSAPLSLGAVVAALVENEEPTSPLLLHPVDGLTTSSGNGSGGGGDGGGGTETEGGENYMIMIHKLYLERLQSYLLHRCRSDDCEKTSSSSSAWTTISTTSKIATTKAAATIAAGHPHCVAASDDLSINTTVTNHNSSIYVTFQIVHIPQLTGDSQAQRGYVIPSRTTPTTPTSY